MTDSDLCEEHLYQVYRKNLKVLKRLGKKTLS